MFANGEILGMAVEDGVEDGVQGQALPHAGLCPAAGGASQAHCVLPDAIHAIAEVIVTAWVLLDGTLPAISCSVGLSMRDSEEKETSERIRIIFSTRKYVSCTTNVKMQSTCLLQWMSSRQGGGWWRGVPPLGYRSPLQCNSC